VCTVSCSYEPGTRVPHTCLANHVLHVDSQLLRFQASWGPCNEPSQFWLVDLIKVVLLDQGLHGARAWVLGDLDCTCHESTHS
jgi:hypothetical protein